LRHTGTGKPIMLYMRTLRDIASVRSLAVSRYHQGESCVMLI
jgi:hypothetical protein